ncbi:ABC transporter ATP-binding protein [Myxococcus sp. MISCRS1]|jgi:ABC-2 type transport system ATP-binding protein|uniref:ABC transporter ATP-binding protein n=1 Tax=Myxococcus TaxID=32 RepID=UPI001CBE4EDA|nr:MULTISPECIES: ABC transporter ATP-binding protein [Myxococcus]BDT36441.1 ABC transporter ATP-binding protein [Myxococcus sp. MH1]MBZ4395012.1 ABC transporter ATP-binding protein [Myxococcus sp. AS-1-15]MBZ4406797.1 ABC transporter ATP-binding protein [Myxococcus sp. XM-1-1-1]MCK8497476.1 ABC transporter ATP-binding protein [Myxococcus fulvus]MCY1001992.1 ABC transporter ATP-binding protein [Myxococcus sp. MISCRS1]
MPDTSVHTPPPALLHLEGLTRRFKDRVAVDGLTLSVRPGEILGLLGPNGAGKSTTFQILAGLLAPDAGQVRFAGRELSLSDPALRRQMGIIFQRGSLDDLLTARENLMLGARLYGLTGERARERVESMLGLIGLLDRGDERVGTWSGGMRRRLELARALVHQPRVVLMDEPTQGLDEAAFRTFWAHLKRLRDAEGLTVLLTTHRADEAEVCDRLAVLDAGKLVACDTPAALAARMGGDLLTVEAPEPETLAREVREKLGVDAKVVEGRVQVEARQGHALVPRLVESFPAGRMTSVALRRPTLADVFLQLTGRALGADVPAVEAAPRRRR